MPRLLVLFAAFSFAVFPETGESLDRGWIKAVLGNDQASLGKILADDLVYAHSSGIVDTKTEYLAKLRSGRQVYKTFDQQRVTARTSPGVIVTHSWVRVTGINPKGPFDDKVMMLHVWVQTKGEWRLLAHQTTKVP